MSTRGPRGPYRKSADKRQQILDAALTAYAEAGSRKVTVRDIAERVGMTDAGVVHHFGGREALLTAVLAARDAADAATYGDLGTASPADLLTNNARTPGLVKLFVDLAAAAAEPEHPAHDFFTERYTHLRTRIADSLESYTPTSPGPAADTDPAWTARILLAAVDGLQLQWLLNPEIDMAGDIETLCKVLLAALPDRQPAPER
ncbi:TetR/AcrR family transcriptional regulator [Embleya sp. NPDC020886]|uniref:TetR/AcrR family transcriptional regulator n=1 Tax=Embleya sp. NPDC020886 TaxID=3363980 RepID=UPI003794D6C7